MSLVPQGFKIYYQQKTKVNDGMSLGLNPENEPAFWRNGNLMSYFLIISGVKVNQNYTITGLSKNRYLSDDRNTHTHTHISKINQKQKCSKGSTVYYWVHFS